MEINNVCKVMFTDSIETILNKISFAFSGGSDALRLCGLFKNIYCFKSSAHINEILIGDKTGFHKGNKIMPRVKYVMGSGGYIDTNLKDWKNKRSQIQRGFSEGMIQNYAFNALSTSHNFIEQFKIKNGQKINISIFVYELVIFIIFKIFYSYSLTNNELIEVRKCTNYINKNFVKFTPLKLPFPSCLKFKNCVLKLRKLFLKIIMERKSSSQNHEDLLSHLLTIKKIDKKYLDNEELVDEIFSIFFGASVMGTTLIWCAYELSKSQALQEQIHYEASICSNSLTQNFVMKNVIKEVLRLYPPSWSYPRITKDVTYIGRYRIPKNSYLLPMIWHMHRDKSVWEDPLRFNPERFQDLIDSKSKMANYCPFGRGLRTCLGAKLAPKLMQSVLVAIYSSMYFTSEDIMPSLEFGFEIYPKRDVFLQANYYD